LSRIHTATAAPIVNISESGALVEVPTSLRPGTIYVLRLALGGRELNLRSRVVRSQVQAVKPGAGGESAITYSVAVEFVGLLETDRAVLRQNLVPQAGVVEGDLEEDFE
jgi:PilZ domain